ncbi:hypothetical protein FCM35_KLT08925 [Carex littledalei]|uniref:Uncharacterized protein n=1 Tax=Carex littledalei TaxID=544730 RepID=A0A833VH06_9POAL|nr:hypothetical protein FCM35_KLT08925 [Carex littledalei]
MHQEVLKTLSPPRLSFFLSRVSPTTAPAPTTASIAFVQEVLIPSSSTMNGDALRRSRSFRQRSMTHSNGEISISPFDVDNGGMRTSQYMTKLEMLEQSVHGSVDPVVVFKTVLLVCYVLSTRLTLSGHFSVFVSLCI